MEVREAESIRAVHRIPRGIYRRGIGVGHLTTGVVVVVPLHTVIEQSGTCTDDPFTLAADVPGEIQAGHPLHRHVRKNALGYISPRGQLKAIWLIAITIDKDTLAVIVQIGVEQGTQSAALEVLREVTSPQSRFYSEVRTQLPAVLCIELIIVQPEVIERTVGGLAELNRSANVQITE